VRLLETDINVLCEKAIAITLEGYDEIIDADPTRVTTLGGQHVFETDTDVLDHGMVLVEYPDGTKATLDLCMYAPFGQLTRLYELRGSDRVFSAVIGVIALTFPFDIPQSTADSDPSAEMTDPATD